MIVNEKIGLSQDGFLFDHLRPNSKQYVGFEGGWGVGKTYVYIKKAILLHYHTKADGLLAEPNYTMNQRLIIPEMRRQLDAYKIPYRYIGGTKNWFETPWGRIILATQNRRDSLEGHNIGWFGFDEMDLMDKDKAEENWHVITSKLRVGDKVYGYFTGTNEGYKFVYNKFYKDSENTLTEHYISKNGAEYSRKIYDTHNTRLYMASTYENEVNLPKNRVEQLINDFPDVKAKRYIHGDFVNINQGQIYYSFTRDNVKYVPFDPHRKTAMSWDVNFSNSPMCTSLIQEFDPSEIFEQIPDYINPNKKLYVTVKHFANTETNTETQCREIYEYLTNQGFNAELKIYGDYAGVKREASSSKSHYEIVSNWFQPFGVGSRYTFNIKPTKSVYDRVNTMNRYLRDSEGFRRHLISSGDSTYKEDRGLKLLIEDFEQVVWSKSGNKMDKTSTGRTDPTDADSYYFYYNFDLATIKPKSFIP